MKAVVLGILGAAIVAAPAVMFAQGAAKATYITKEQVDTVNATPGTDRTPEVFDLGKTAMSVAVIHRGPTTPAAGRAGGGGAAGGRGAAAGRANAPAPVPCGEKVASVPTGAAAGMIAHDQTTETYIVISGAGTLITGGHVVNGSRSAPDSEVTRILNGPSCSGPSVGADVVRKVVKVGDIIVIPAGVPHGWTEIGDHVDYLSVRPDPDKVLQHGYIHPAMAGK
jgi:hypothetical protein